MTYPTFLRIPLNEWKRKAVHMGCFGFAFLLPYITPTQAVLGAIAAFCFNAFLLPKLIPSIMRPDENGKPMGLLEVILYPAAVLATIVAFNCDPGYYGEWWILVFIGWFSLAILDALIGIFCKIFAKSLALPWNPRKPMLGVMVGLLTSIVSFILIMYFYSASQNYWPRNNSELVYSVIYISVLLCCCAVAETIWFGIADNLMVPFCVSIYFITVRASPNLYNSIRSGFYHGHWMERNENIVFFLLPLVFSLAAYLINKITVGGAILGFIIAEMLILTDAGLFLFLLGFFILGVGATRYGMSKKIITGVAEMRGGARGPAEIFGAAGMAAWLIPKWWLWCTDLHYRGCDGHEFLIIISPLIAKTMDTVSSEIGKAVGGKTISLMNFRLVPPGTAGAVSLAGTLWGLAAAALLAALIFPLHWGGFAQWGILIAIAVAANLFESYWGAWAAPRGLDDGPHTNFLMTLFAAVLAWFVWGR
jgi:uncharacterized protein (TIGR00297 family)